MIVLQWGMIELVVTSAEPRQLLNTLTRTGMSIYHIKPIDELSMGLSIKESDLSTVRTICAMNRAEIKILSRTGIIFLLKRLLKRHLLLAGIFLWLFLNIYLPSRILFVEVEGNEVISAQQIIEKAERCGIFFGQERKLIRSEKVKNALLSEIPELKWVGINTTGCLAVISVSERVTAENSDDKPHVGHIVATQDGVISQLIVTKGSKLCVEGQAVTKGQVLVSGYTDCGLFVRAEEASAEVMAVTERNLKGKIPTKYLVRNEIINEDIEYSIQLGKNIVKLSNKARIYNGNCAKIYKRKFLTLPGGFQLPLALIYERTVCYEDTVSAVRKDDLTLTDLADRYLRDQMLMGRILESHYKQLPSDDSYCFEAVYICEEMIGKQRQEEIGKENG